MNNYGPILLLIPFGLLCGVVYIFWIRKEIAKDRLKATPQTLPFIKQESHNSELNEGGTGPIPTATPNFSVGGAVFLITIVIMVIAGLLFALGNNPRCHVCGSAISSGDGDEVPYILQGSGEHVIAYIHKTCPHPQSIQVKGSLPPASLSSPGASLRKQTREEREKEERDRRKRDYNP